jgi:glycolate oxidase FAD binding subunit
MAMSEQDISSPLQHQLAAAYEATTPLCIRGGNSKAFYGRPPIGELFDVSGHRGIISYEPTELVITARAGTPLREIETALAEQQQMLAFEPPHLSDTATLGGTIACNLSGPRRPYCGAARDFILGTRILNGKGELLSFGGEVMKNVAGYDSSRLMAGALGTLGVLLDISLKVLPRAETELTLVHSGLTAQQALDHIHHCSALPLPLSATAMVDDRLYLRLSGTDTGVQAAQLQLGGDQLNTAVAERHWQQLKEQTHPFFQAAQPAQQQPRPLWRLSVASDTPPMALSGDWLYEWGGGQRWLISDEAPSRIRQQAAAAGGHATLYRHHSQDGTHDDDVFQPLPAALLRLHQRLKLAFDPQGILNPGRLYAGL